MYILLIFFIGFLAYLFYKKGVMDTEDNQKEKERHVGFQSIYHKIYSDERYDFKNILAKEFTLYEHYNGSEKRKKIVIINENLSELNAYFFSKMTSSNPYSINIKDIFIIVCNNKKYTFESNETITMAVLFALMLLYDGINKDWNILKDKDFKKLAIEALNEYKI